jgi:hypothetical protein
LLSAIEVHNFDLADDVKRFRAIGVMLRSTTVALSVAALVAFVEIFTSGRPTIASTCFVLLAGAAVMALHQGNVAAYWAKFKTYELASWLPEVQDKFSNDNSNALDHTKH